MIARWLSWRAKLPVFLPFSEILSASTSKHRAFWSSCCPPWLGSAQVLYPATPQHRAYAYSSCITCNPLSSLLLVDSAYSSACACDLLNPSPTHNRKRGTNAHFLVVILRVRPGQITPGICCRLAMASTYTPSSAIKQSPTSGPL